MNFHYMDEHNLIYKSVQSQNLISVMFIFTFSIINMIILCFLIHENWMVVVNLCYFTNWRIIGWLPKLEGSWVTGSGTRTESICLPHGRLLENVVGTLGVWFLLGLEWNLYLQLSAIPFVIFLFILGRECYIFRIVSFSRILCIMGRKT